MVVITACVALALLGVVMVIRWGGEAAAPDGAAHRDREGWLEYFLFALAAGVVAGVVAAGAGGRLVMRLLAATWPEAEGSLTEADEVVGEISAGGTLSLIAFVGLFAGVLSDCSTRWCAQRCRPVVRAA